MSAFAETQLIAPACHDTASAIAGIPGQDAAWAYISSGTWSLVGVVNTEAHRNAEAFAAGFTNLGAAGGKVLFHRGLVGMWLLRQCLNTWENARGWELGDLIAQARALPAPDALLDLDDAAFVTPGDMPARMNAQRVRHGLSPLPGGCDEAPRYANLIFHSLAHRYAAVLREIEALTRKRPECICVVGGGNRNEYLNSLTSEATGLPVKRCAAESSTLGNFAVQWARLEQDDDGVSETAIADRAGELIEILMRA
jgi:rhamnulokinase